MKRICSLLEKWVTAKKQITASETVTANKMLNCASSEGDSNKTMKCWVFNQSHCQKNGKSEPRKYGGSREGNSSHILLMGV